MSYRDKKVKTRTYNVRFSKYVSKQPKQNCSPRLTKTFQKCYYIFADNNNVNNLMRTRFS